MMANDLEKLLESGLLKVPENFAQQVMQRIDELPLPIHPPQSLEWLRWLALVGGAILGVTQLAGFVFGIWVAVTAG